MKHKENPEVLFEGNSIITNLTPFLKGNPAEYQYLTIFNFNE